MKVRLHSFVSLALEGDEWLPSRCAALCPKKSHIPLNMWLGGPQNRSARSEKKEKKKCFVSAGIRMSDRPARSLVTVPTKMFLSF